MEERVGHSLRRQHISAVLLSAFALGALLLAAMGLYGVVAGAVMRRRHELALRLAGRAGHLLRGTRHPRGAAGGDAARSATLTSVAVGLGLVTMLACYVPARRVLGLDPAQLRRQE